MMTPTLLSQILLYVVLLILCIGMIAFLFLKKRVIIEAKDDEQVGKNIFPFLFSSIAIIVSMIALAVTLPRTDTTYSADYWDVLIAILSLLVTILIGWQIYNGIKFEKQVLIANKAAESAKKTFNQILGASKAINKAKEEAQKSAEEIKSMNSDFSASLIKVQSRSAEFDKKMDDFDEKVTVLDKKVVAVDSKIAEINDKLTTMKEKVSTASKVSVKDGILSIDTIKFDDEEKSDEDDSDEED